MKSPDVLVLGLGVIGSAVARALARAGHRVIGLERNPPAHDLGSSGGESRMFHDTGTEPRDEFLRARTLWQEIEADADDRFFLPTGSVRVAAPGGPTGPGPAIDVAELRRRVPAVAWPDDTRAVFDEEAGIHLNEACLRALHGGACRGGAELRFGVDVPLDGLLARWAERRTVVAGGEEIAAGALVIALGPWAPHVASGLTVERVHNVWFDPGAADLSPAHTPYIIWFDPAAPFCMFPTLPRGVKVGFRWGQTGVDATTLDRTVAADDIARAHAALRARTGLDLRVRSTWVSTYTHTPDGNFRVEPLADRAFLVSACSGRGWKSAPVVAEQVVALL